MGFNFKKEESFTDSELNELEGIEKGSYIFWRNKYHIVTWVDPLWVDPIWDL